MFTFQLLILDGDKLKSDPIAVMDKVQMFLRLEPYFDYSIRLKYVLYQDAAMKGFVLVLVNMLCLLPWTLDMFSWFPD